MAAKASRETRAIQTLLVANRGEIAARVMRTARRMGIRTVAVHSDPDAGAIHVRTADVAVSLGGTTSGESYLRPEKIIAAALETGADAIHPGYGFLSENADFARACDEAGITFVGPSPESIVAMGDKITAKKTMDDAGVPIVPGWTGSGDESDEVMVAHALEVGFPLMVKAAAGGGGKGMRLVESADDIAGAVAAARREAGSAFGDARVFLERYVSRARHIEFQIFGDTHGNVVHLFERECSVQRRHQKIVEEAPSPALTPELRATMGAAAVAAGKAIGYCNAGTVEFMLGDDGAFYFLEVNTRLQVEHPVTEMTTGLDLVAAQIAVASGAPLPWRQDELEQRGHSFECRVYAEDPSSGFLPSTGTLVVCDEPEGPGIRVDSGVGPGSEVSVHYDPMLSKLITWGSDRTEAAERMKAALDAYAVIGVRTNIPFMRALFDHAAFIAGDLHTGFLDEHAIDAGVDEVPGLVEADDELPEAVLIAAALAREGLLAGSESVARASDGGGEEFPSPWLAAGGWRSR